MACIAVVLNGPKAKNGRKVFESFVEQNKSCFWNRDLVTASESLIYMGFMRPGTLFISGDQQHLSTLKDAWARRILKPAIGYTITSLGDLGAIQQVEQMHFVPLGDVICDSVAQLNRAGLPATETSIRQYVARHCAHVAPPGAEMVRQTITSLLATGFIYKMGEHFFVSVPTNSPPKQKATAECQTGVSIMMAKAATPKVQKRKSIFSRLFSKGVRPTAAAMMPQPCGTSAPLSFSPAQCLESLAAPMPPPLPAGLPPKNKFATYHAELKNECCGTNEIPKEKQRTRRRRRETAKLLSSSSECLNYGPIDPPEMLPGSVEMIDEMVKPMMTKTRGPAQRSAYNRRRTVLKAKEQPVAAPIARTSTPIETDSAYSPSPVTDSNDDMGCQSDPEINHTYINLAKMQLNNDSTQFEDLTCDDLPLPPSHVRGVLISNL